VVVGYDGSPSGDAALTTAIDEARARGVPLHLVSAIELPASMPVYEGAYRRATAQAVHAAVLRAAAALGEDRVTSHVDAGSPTSLLLHQAERTDLLVVGSHGHRPVARMLLGSTSTAVASHALGPVLVVRGPRMRSLGPVVVGVDGSDGSMAAVHFAVQAAARERATLHAVMAVPPVTDAFGFVSGPDDPQLTAARALLAETVAGVAVDQPDLVVEQSLVQTHPVEALLRHAQGARLVVVGSRGRGGLEAMVLGSVSRELLHHASCPVLVVRAAPAPVAAGDGV
jgi:nucleotide-binding universal stress UspA family protein